MSSDSLPNDKLSNLQDHTRQGVAESTWGRYPDYSWQKGISDDPNRPFNSWYGHEIIAHRNTPIGGLFMVKSKTPQGDKYLMFKINPWVRGGLEDAGIYNSESEMYAAFLKLTGLKENNQVVAEADGSFSIVFYDAGDDVYKTIAKGQSYNNALKIIKNNSDQMYDEGDHLRKISSNIYVHEPDYKNTGERASANNYKHMYHWIIKPEASGQGVAEGTMRSTKKLKSTLYGIFSQIYAGAMDGEEMIDYVADELGDYYRAVELSKDPTIQQAYSLMREKGGDSEGDPKQMSRVAWDAMSILRGEQGVTEGKKSDRYHIVDKDGKPVNLASYADRASAIKDRDEKYPGAVVQQVGPRGKVKGVAGGSGAVCPSCHSADIKTYSDGEKECNHCHKTWDVQGVAEGLPGSLSKSDYTAGATKKHTSTNCTTCQGRKVMYKTPDGKLHADNKQGAKKISCPVCKGTGDKQGVAEGHADQQRKIFKKNGKPVGEVGIDRESSPGVGQWYMKCYLNGIDNAGYDSYQEAVAELKHCLKQGVAEGSLEEIDRRGFLRNMGKGAGAIAAGIALNKIGQGTPNNQLTRPDDESWYEPGKKWDTSITSNSEITNRLDVDSSNKDNPSTTQSDSFERIASVQGPNAKGEYKVAVIHNDDIVSYYVTKNPPQSWLRGKHQYYK